MYLLQILVCQHCSQVHRHPTGERQEGKMAVEQEKVVDHH